MLQRLHSFDYWRGSQPLVHIGRPTGGANYWRGPSFIYAASLQAPPAKLSTQARDVQLNALAARFNNGYLRIYTGAQPATPNTAASGTLLAELRFPSPAFATVSGGGPLVANPIIEDASGDATGTPGWYRCLESDGTTPILDGTVGTAGANLNFSSLSFEVGIPVRVSAYTHTLPMAA